LRRSDDETNQQEDNRGQLQLSHGVLLRCGSDRAEPSKTGLTS
jgi:hypothetical protein